MLELKETWFIEEVDPFDIKKEEACLHLTKYKLLTHEEIEIKLDKEISRSRWVTLVDAKVGCGYASGKIIVEGKTFDLSYAWGGLNSREDYHIRESYTVQIKGSKCGEFFAALARKINDVEGKKDCIGNSLGVFTINKRLKPYKLDHYGKSDIEILEINKQKEFEEIKAGKKVLTSYCFLACGSSCLFIPRTTCSTCEKYNSTEYIRRLNEITKSK